jgi:hypothetical protein
MGAAGPQVAAGRRSLVGVPGDVPPTKNVYLPDRTARSPPSCARASDDAGIVIVTVRLKWVCGFDGDERTTMTGGGGGGGQGDVAGKERGWCKRRCWCCRDYFGVDVGLLASDSACGS